MAARDGISHREDNSSIQKHARDTKHIPTSFRDAKYLRIYWHDYTSVPKCRVIPMARVLESLEEGEEPYTISVTKASLGILPNDHPIPGVTGTGIYVLEPDWASAKKGPAPGHVSCQAFFHEDEIVVEDGGSAPASESPLCPRGILRRALRHAEASAGGGLTFLVGFEIEFTVLEPTGDPKDKFRMLSTTTGHSWTTAGALATWGAPGSFLTAADELLDALRDAGVAVQQFHAESTPGQYEIVLGPQPPLEACDTLLHTRQVLESTAARHGFRATLHPRPFAPFLGSGAHAHMSISSAGGDAPAVYERFYGGVLAHFPAVFALTDAHPTSYERMQDGLWAGGRWVTWGTHNKETPLRKCKDSHWEVKVLDGMANPYLALAALVFAGTEGAAFTWGDCEVDPATLGDAERTRLGIETKFPASVEEACECLRKDETMVRLLGKEFVERYVAVKKAEVKLYDSIPEDQRTQWVMERY
ncbi:hypothetical protein F4808DRAFT_138659 [Astrocystis sublimbata]|nr:hypothetical protein F4808DRAFT_138659 [Astrocystis sublimbata]